MATPVATGGGGSGVDAVVTTVDSPLTDTNKISQGFGEWFGIICSLFA